MAKKEAQYTLDDQGNLTIPFAPGGDFEPVPAGEYDLIIQQIEVREGRESGDPYFALELRITDPDPEIDNKPVWENISPKAAWRVTQLVEAVYGEIDEVEEGDDIDINIFDLYGAQVRADVGQEENNKGRVVNTINRFLVAEGGGSSKTSSKKKSTKKKTRKKK